ncbi:hypothetical protein [Pseudonocardia sp. ICBG601]|uniref:hypothetical protein n=1 Tax=Pseudonocardia sp. ICBG601 TaxID=2846759 RepID=UPI001CF654B6|nr:hypothetical protein [Pseudonocardia sp. ICBG601]
MISFVDPAVLAAVLGRAQPTAPLLVAARVGVEVADLRHARWVALRDASKQVSVAYTAAGLARQPSLAELMRRRYPPHGDPARWGTWGRGMSTTAAHTAGRGQVDPDHSRPSGRGPEATRQHRPSPAHRPPRMSRLAVQVADGRELAVLVDGPWRGRWYWADDLAAMQDASRRYPDGPRPPSSAPTPRPRPGPSTRTSPR